VADEQQHLPVVRRQRGERTLDAPLELAAAAESNGDGHRVQPTAEPEQFGNPTRPRRVTLRR
jgi:hypothetical protein